MARRKRSYARVDHAARIAAYKAAIEEGLTMPQVAKSLGITVQNLYVWRSELRRKKRIKLPLPDGSPVRQARRKPRVVYTKPPVVLTFVMNVSNDRELVCN